MRPGCVVVLATLAVWAGAMEVERYTTRYDNINIDNILRNERLLNKYMQCLLAEKDNTCTPEGKEIRKIIPDALTNDCSKCNERQRGVATKLVKHIRDKRPADWEKLQAKYDPDGTYLVRYQQQLEQLDNPAEPQIEEVPPEPAVQNENVSSEPAVQNENVSSDPAVQNENVSSEPVVQTETDKQTEQVPSTL